MQGCIDLRGMMKGWRGCGGAIAFVAAFRGHRAAMRASHQMQICSRMLGSATVLASLSKEKKKKHVEQSSGNCVGCIVEDCCRECAGWMGMPTGVR